ncbi:hypothetical protein Q8A67_024191 [Cirrhinus molitorella]|uniref:Uncharacterized protein n=1 Tax=Cirrhinus molitorella TaxID=172907 RepID=A0AA88P469_9TELE|nr:hypothetical protein Q8A67_024191 [Cirrhinus molitorella]
MKRTTRGSCGGTLGMLVRVVSAPHVCGPQAVRYRKEPESGRMRFASKFPPVPFATSLVYHLEVLSQTARNELSAQEERLILIRG